MNGDGRADLAVANYANNNVSVLLNNGAGSFGAVTNYNVGKSPNSVVIGDLDGDNKADMATANFEGASASVLINNGAGGFASAVNYNVGAAPYAVTLGDVSGDGRPDLAVANQGSASVSVLINTGTGTFASAVNYGADNGPRSVAVGDLNGDGKPDMAIANNASNNVSVLLNNGSGIFGAATNYNVGRIPCSVAIRDFNGDGKPDIATADGQGNTVSMLRNDGSGLFGPAITFAVGTTPLSLAVADFNSDGVPDVATSNVGSNNLSVLLLRLPTPSPIRYVRQGGTGDGNSWATASGDLQSQINATGATQVWVAGGTYKPTTGTDRSSSFAMKNGVVIYGGFPNTGTPTLSDRNPASYLTTLSGDIGTVGSNVDNSYHVIRNAASLRLDNTAILDGFSVVNGNANGVSVTDTYGGGVLNSGTGASNSCNPQYRNCVFSDNAAAAYGGAMFNDGTSAGTSSPLLINCVFQKNVSAEGGGALSNTGYNGGTSSPGLVNCSFIKNVTSTSSYGGGGAISNSGGVGGTCNPVLTNCSFLDNTGNRGWAILSDASRGGTCTVTLVNCIIFGNYGPNGASTLYSTEATVRASYSLFETGVVGYTDGGNNKMTDVSPFVSSASVALNACTVAINAGNSQAYNTAGGPTTDLAGNPRVFGSTIDMGAYEFQGTPSTRVAITSQPDTASTVCVGASVTVDIAVSGTGPFTYQWYKAGAPLTGNVSATTGTLTLSDVITTSAGTYSVVVTNACNSVTSIAFTLTINPRPVVSITPSATAVCAGQEAQLTASGGTSYRWSNGQTTASISTTAEGAYSVTATTNGCSNTATASLTVNPLPVVSITNLSTAYCQTTASVGLSGTPSGGVFTLDGTVATSFVPANLATGQHTVVYSFTNNTGCSATASQSFTINALPVVAITGLASAYCQDAVAVTLAPLGTPTGGSFTIDGTTATVLDPIKLTVGDWRVVYTYTDNKGCSNTAVQTVTIREVPAAPSLLTQAGQTYPGGQSAVTVDVNTGTVMLLVGGCTGSVTWTGPNTTSGMGNSITVPTNAPGTFVYQATCQRNGCTSLPASATVTIGSRLTVLHRDVDNYANNNAIQPLIQVINQGAGALPLSALTLRYYVTVEGAATLGNLFVNYAQVGNQHIRLRYVPLQTPQQGAQGYVEIGFAEGAGSLASGATTGPIQTYLTKADYGSLNELDDYSYATVRDQLLATLRITAYYNGVLVYGQEPGTIPSIRAVRALTESKNGALATQIGTFLEVRNEGNVSLNYSDLKVRYYFTADGNERLQVEVDEGNVSTKLVKLPSAINRADTYLELTFNQSGQLAPGNSTGTIRYRILKPDGGRFNQANDYSYQEQPAERSQNGRAVVLANSEVVWGTLPTNTGARMAAAVELGADLNVRLLGNPIVGAILQADVTGAAGQSLTVQLTDLQGRVVTTQHLEAASPTQRVQLPMSQQTAGLFLLQVSTPTQSKTLKVLKAD